MLAAADELFAERGFERTTIREIGQLAGVDPTLIARYFGSKAELYLAALRRDQPGDDDPLDLREPRDDRPGDRPGRHRDVRPRCAPAVTRTRIPNCSVPRPRCWSVG